MRCLYRERKFYCGDYLEVEIFPVFRKSNRRGKKAKPTSEVQARLNENYAVRTLTRVLNANFKDDDIEIHLTYRDECLPQTAEEASKNAQNYIRRVKRYRASHGLDELKFVLVPAGGVEGTRFHFHVTMNAGVDRSVLEELWGFGYANSRQLQFNENGIEGLAKYMARQFKKKTGKSPFKKRWSASRNLINPKPRDRDGRLSQCRVREIANQEVEAREAFETLYDEYCYSECFCSFNEMNDGYYLRVKMYRKGCVFRSAPLPKNSPSP